MLLGKGLRSLLLLLLVLVVSLAFRAKLNSFLASCLVLDRLHDEFVGCNKLGYHLLEADKRLIGMRDRGPVEVRLVAIR